MSSQTPHRGSSAMPVPAPDDSDFLDSDDGHGHELTEMEAELAAVATPATSQTTTATASMRRRQRLTPITPIMQMTHNFSFAVFESPIPSADALNCNGGRDAAGLPAIGSPQRSGRAAASSPGSPSRLQGQRRRAAEQQADEGSASTIAPHLAADATIHWFSVDTELVYLSFFDDWGPLNVAMFYRFCLHLHHLINSAHDDAESGASQSGADGNLHLILYTSSDARLKANAALLAAMYAMVCGDATPADAFWPLANLELLPFRDAGYGRADYYLTIQDVLYGVHRAISEQLLDLMTFDLEEYETYEQVQNGDWNWITPNIIAFASPNDKEYVNELRDRSQNLGRATPGLRRPLNPTFLKTIKYFKEHNVKLVVRLNNPLYDSRVFEREGIEHVDMYFDDGSNPSEDIVRNFIAKADKVISSGGVIAVHCKAGLGRTGVLIGAYLAYRHNFSAGEAIGFMRIMRPGCVVGPQQHFMYKEMPNWIRWREQDEAALRLEQALAKQKLELVGKRRLSMSRESSGVDTDAEVDISLGESPARHYKKMRKSSQGPTTPTREEDMEARVHIAKPTPCVGQPRKSPSPSRKRSAQAAQAPMTVGRIGSGSFNLARPRVLSNESTRTNSSGVTTRRMSGRQQKALEDSNGAAEGEEVAMPSQGSRVLLDSPRVHNVMPTEVQSFTAIVEGGLEAAALPHQNGHLERNKGHATATGPADTSDEENKGELFLQGWRNPDSPSAYIKQLSSPSRAAASQQSKVPSSPGTPTRNVVGASPHIREMFGLRESGSNQNTPRSRKEAVVAQSPSATLRAQVEPSSSNGSLSDRNKSASQDDLTALQPGPISKDGEGSRHGSHNAEARQIKRIPSAQSRGKTAPAAPPSTTQRQGQTTLASSERVRNTSGSTSRPQSRAAAPAARPNAASSTAGRVALARERIAQRQNAASQPSSATDAATAGSLKRPRNESPSQPGDRAPSVKRSASSSQRTRDTSVPRPALAPASSAATNGTTRPGTAAATPRFAMSTAASAAKSVGTAARDLMLGKADKIGPTPGRAGQPGTQGRLDGGGHHVGTLNGRSARRRRSSLGETDIVM